jgi:sorbitol-6-phosphate 2-dehydrogenase
MNTGTSVESSPPSESIEIDQHSVLVTGAGSGVGRRVVISLLEQQANITAVDSNADALHELAQSCESTQLLTIQSSLESVCEADNIVSQALDRFGYVTGLVGCAGKASTGLLRA